MPLLTTPFAELELIRQPEVANDPLQAFDAADEYLLSHLAQQQPGFLGMESTRGADGLGITVAYWESEAAILAWRQHAEHTAAREQGRRDWYDHFELRVARVERAYGWDRGTAERRG